MSKPNIERLFIPYQLWSSMQSHVDTEAPLEACGILGGSWSGFDLHTKQVYPAKNELSSTHSYRMDPNDQLQIFNQLEKNGLHLAAIYHSHPQGPASPSLTDINQAYYPDSIYLIWSFSEEKWQCRGYLILEKEVYEIPVIIERDISGQSS